jgi:hypothetical protein
MRQDARPAMKAQLSPGPIWLPLLPKSVSLGGDTADGRSAPRPATPSRGLVIAIVA